MNCPRCKKRPKALNKGRCIECLEYQARWQRERTDTLKREYKCITCARQTPETLDGQTRCNNCNNKKKNHLETELAVSA